MARTFTQKKKKRETNIYKKINKKMCLCQQIINKNNNV